MTICENRTDDLLIPQGTTWRKQWPLFDAEGQPLPLNNWTAKGQVRRYKDSEEVLYEFNTEDDTIVLTESSIMLVVEPATSSAWEWGEGHYDVEMTSPSGSVTRVLQGRIVKDQETTR